ncbi:MULTISPECIES: HK97-gp10 family putative phage morphogenesis protein [Bacteria]|jgi:HK97 gp10 family phage protein|uniref:HK97-gp10 family putative phage morphogenesis protein n=1 Tax=Bacteria TaxID=2 RepID=UPI000E50C576|nr:HK97-gp10 family putative phage morphogenesis protein [Fusobacterium ulcerans]RGY66050.1 HK97 gp10 family phage protein [Fusobacterium ulcerans]DAO65988.1 MAG TPA: Minor capsid protein [Caudoviricetes sp.]
MKFYAKVTSNDLTKALGSISAWDGKTRLAVENALQNGTKAVARGAKQRVAQRSGKLKKSIKTGFDRRKPEGMVRAKTPYAHIVEFGSKSYTLRAKNKKALTIPGGSALVLRKSAKIPARKGRPFIEPSFEAEEPKIVSSMKKVLNK